MKHGPCLLTEKRIQALESKCLMILHRISYLEHKTNNWVRSKINFLVVPHEPLPANVKRRKLAWFGHVTRHDRLSTPIRKSTLEGGRGGRCPVRQRKCWIDNIKEWTSLPMPKLLTRASAKKTGRGSLLNCPSCPPYDPISPGLDWTELMFMDALANINFGRQVFFINIFFNLIVFICRIIAMIGFHTNPCRWT